MRVLLRRFPALNLAIAVAIAISLIAIGAASQPKPRARVTPSTVAVRKPRPKVGPQAVRGYIAVRPAAKNADIAAVFIPAGKDIYLPGVDVYLSDPQTNQTSNTVRTDLSGRFTVFAPQAGRYHVCWKSPVYGAGCDSRFISVGNRPQFVSTVRIQLPVRPRFVSIAGHVVNADNSVPRTFDPMFNINSFATVRLDNTKGVRLAEVYVNNFGDYLLPYVPVRQEVNITASIESANVRQQVLPGARIEAAAMSRVNLKFENHRPRLNPLVAFDSVSNRRVQNGTPGSTLKLQATARDLDGDPLKYAWFAGEGQGSVLQNTGPTTSWQLPSAPGRYTIAVVAYDGKGGYDKAQLSVLATGGGVPFGGIVVDTAGTPVAGAEVEIVGNPVVNTDARGRFNTNVKESFRYVLNIRRTGFALNSQIYDGGITGGRWVLRRAQIVTVDPTHDIRVVHERSPRDCPGPDSVRAGSGVAGNSLDIPEWQDGKGNAIDAPGWWKGPRSVRAGQNTPIVAVNNRMDAKDQGQPEPVILPRQLKFAPCGRGVSVDIPANSILDAQGNPASGPIQVAISTIDLLSPQQMPGDFSAVGNAGAGRMESFGAGSLDLPAGFTLKSGSPATVTIPVDRSRLIGGVLPPTVPLLSYNEQKGLWMQDDTLTLTTVSGVKAYVGQIKHFTTFNADTVLVAGAACLRVFSPSLPGQYDLEAITPYPDGTPHYKKYPIDNTSSTEHVIYNITPNANISLAPMTQGANSQLLGYYIVNSGPPENPSHAPDPPPGPPYTTCQNFIILTVDGAPESPFGGEFLHGLGYLAAENLGFDDLTTAAPTGNALRDAIVQASRNYYASADPLSQRTTFADFKSKNGFSANPNTPAAGEIVARYANSGDLGFGRDMHCLKQTNGDVACYVTNYGTGYNNSFPGDGTPDTDDAQAAATRSTVAGSTEVATVAMEYTAIENDGADRAVKFFVYKLALPGYARSISANLDGRGERPVPQLCMICHGGAIPNQSGNPLVPVFGSAADVKFNSRFLPFDYRFFTFDPAASKVSQDPSFKALNEQIVNAAPPAGVTDPIHEVVSGLYNNGAATAQVPNFVVPGWATGVSPNAPGQANFYTGVIANPCRTCHVAQAFPELQFNTSDKFINVNNPGFANNKLMLGTAQFRVCGDYTMPHALRTHDIFWNVYPWNVADWGPPPTPYYQQLQTFGDGIGGSTWKAGLCTSFVSGTVHSPSFFYEQSIQPIWSSKCVACHITGGIAPFSLTEGDSFSNLVDGTRVIAGNDSAGTLLQRITATSGIRMPQNCFHPPAPPNGNFPCLDQTDIDKIKAWIRSGAN
jgi:hypothetical protein